MWTRANSLCRIMFETCRILRASSGVGIFTKSSSLSTSSACITLPRLRPAPPPSLPAPAVPRMLPRLLWPAAASMPPASGMPLDMLRLRLGLATTLGVPSSAPKASRSSLMLAFLPPFAAVTAAATGVFIDQTARSFGTATWMNWSPSTMALMPIATLFTPPPLPRPCFALSRCRASSYSTRRLWYLVASCEKVWKKLTTASAVWSRRSASMRSSGLLRLTFTFSSSSLDLRAFRAPRFASRASYCAALCSSMSCHISSSIMRLPFASAWRSVICAPCLLNSRCRSVGAKEAMRVERMLRRTMASSGRPSRSLSESLPSSGMSGSIVSGGSGPSILRT
mmetsp:Transcript_1345/g.3417  ORF Transcript_1345/g.3417 Transcript_1345/m.3417 type:complete len:338 (+) Transcript_1345:172-1185(+)